MCALAGTQAQDCIARASQPLITSAYMMRVLAHLTPALQPLMCPCLASKSNLLELSSAPWPYLLQMALPMGSVFMQSMPWPGGASAEPLKPELCCSGWCNHVACLPSGQTSKAERTQTHVKLCTGHATAPARAAWSWCVAEEGTTMWSALGPSTWLSDR